MSLYFPISEWAVIRHPSTRNFPPGSEVFSNTFVHTCRALSVWLDWYNFRPFSICCLVWSWPISGARCLIKIFIRLGHAISVRQQENRSLPWTVQLQRRSPEDDPSERFVSEGPQDPALSAPAVLRWKGNWIHQNEKATHQDHYYQTVYGELKGQANILPI